MKTPALLTFVWPHWRSVVAVVAPLALMPIPIVSPTSVSTIIFLSPLSALEKNRIIKFSRDCKQIFEIAITMFHAGWSKRGIVN
jgi:hypothetical protein